MEFQKIFDIVHYQNGTLLVQLLIIKTYQRLLQKNGLKFMINQKEITMLIKKLGLKHQC